MCRFLHKLILFLFVIFFYFPLARAGEIDDMKKEMQELKQTVNDLKQIVESQNKKIDELSSSQNKKEKLKPELKMMQTPAVVPDSPQVTPGTAQIPLTDNSSTRQVGLWKYPIGNSKVAKILPDISATGILAGAYFEREPGGPLTGPVGADPARTGFTFQELEIAFQGVVDPYFRYDAFLSFSEEGVEVEEAYFTTQSGLPKGLQFKGGIMLLPFGRQNPKHLHSWTFADNNLVNKYLLGADGLAEAGVEISYLFPTPLFLQFQGTFTNGDNSTSFGGTQKKDFLYNGRLATSFDLTQDLTMLLGGSFAWGYNNTNPGNYTALYGGDLYLKWKPSARTSLAWQTEFIGRQMQIPGGPISEGGLYSFLDYQFFKRWHTVFRIDQMGIPQGLQSRETRLTPAIAFNPTEFSQIRLQYEADKITGLDWANAVILQFMMTLGAHGVHAF